MAIGVGYLNECMSGFEHQVAGHMIAEGLVMEGLAVNAPIHDRYHPSRRNPWNEIECGDHYSRAMASYGVFLEACGYEYHGPQAHLGFAPRITPEDFKAPFTAAEGWGTYEQSIRKSAIKSRIAVKYGQLRLKSVALGLTEGMKPVAARIAVQGAAVQCKLELKDGRAIMRLEPEVSLGRGEQMDIVVE